MGHAVRTRQTLKTLLWGLAIIVLLAATVGFTVLANLGRQRQEITGLKAQLTAATDRLQRLEISIALLSQANKAAPKTLHVSRSVPATLDLTPSEIEIVKAFIKLPPLFPGAQPTINVGDVIAETMLMPIPEQVTERIPKLRGARFTSDRSRSIIIVRSGSGSADIVIRP